GGQRGLDIAHRHRAIDGRAEAAAGDPADRAAVAVGDLGALGRRSPALGPDADAAPRRAAGDLRLDAGGAGEAALLAATLADAPGQTRLDRRGRRVDVVAVQAEAGLQPQRIAGAEADRLDVGMRQQPFGDGPGLGRRDRDLEAVLAGVSGAGDEAGHAADVQRAE